MLDTHNPNHWVLKSTSSTFDLRINTQSLNFSHPLKVRISMRGRISILLNCNLMKDQDQDQVSGRIKSLHTENIILSNS